MSRFMIWAIAVSGLSVFASSANASICGPARAAAEVALFDLNVSIAGGTYSNGVPNATPNSLLGRIQVNNNTPTVTSFAGGVVNFAWYLQFYISKEQALLNCLDAANLD